MPAPTLHLRVPNELAALEPARQQMLGFIASAGLSERLVYQLELVLEESLMNRLWHAFPAGERHHTEVMLHIEPSDVVLCFEDDGIAFDPTQALLPEPAHSLSEARPGGRGLLLMRKAARELRYERCEGRNRLTVWLARA